MNNYELQSHKKSDKIKWVITGVAFLLAFVIIVGLCMQLFGKGKVKPSEWLSKPEQANELLAENEDIIVSGENGDNASPLKLGIVRMANPIASATSGTSYKVTATMTPANTTDKLDMLLRGEDSSKVKLDHADGAFEATVTVVEAFSKTVTLEATVRNRDISTSIKLDYLSKPENKPDYRVEDITDDADFDASKLTYSTGSVKPTRLQGTVTVTLWSSIYDKLKAKGWTDLKQSYTFTYDGSTTADDSTGFGIWNFNLFFASSVNSSRLNDFKYDMYWALYELNGNSAVISSSYGMRVADVNFSGTAYYTLNGVETSCGTFSCDGSPSTFYIKSFSGIAIPATNASLGGNLLFY